MEEPYTTIIVTILSSSVFGSIAGAIVSWIIRTNELKEQRRWAEKREACLEALEIIDAFFSHQSWSTGVEPDRQEVVGTDRVRSCYNRLVLTCEDGDLLDKFKDCLKLANPNRPAKPLTADLIVDLRNAIRKELGFGKAVDQDRERAWISRIPWDNK
jgi:hypothetical protein